MRPTALGVLTALLALLLGGLLAAPSGATGAVGAVGTAPAERPPRGIESRAVVFSVENTNATSVPCLPDNQTYQVRGRLLGAARDLDGLGGPLRVNLLVHDLGTGAWFWDLPGHRDRSYARHLARRGETTLVIDRLGYGASPLADGNATCLGAQADIVHQLVQHLTSGRYRYADPSHGTTPAAAHVVTHGHGVGAAIAQLEAAEFDDVAGLVLMSWTDSGATSLAVRTAARQGRDCLGDDYAPFAATRADYRALMFASAPAAVQRAAARRQSEDPCGDVASLAGAVLGSGFGAGQVDAPVLLLYGGRDPLIRSGARRDQAESYSTEVEKRVFAAAGSSLPLERQARKVRAAVLRWLR